MQHTYTSNVSTAEGEAEVANRKPTPYCLYYIVLGVLGLSAYTRIVL